MHIVFIVDEANFLIPKWLDHVIEKLIKQSHTISIVPLPVRGKQTWKSNLLHHVILMSPRQILKLTLLFLRLEITDFGFRFGLTKNPGTVVQVGQKHTLPILKTRNVNAPYFLDQLGKLQPDIIFSSCSQIFKKKLLALPRIGCVNRHPSLLPKYAGVMPIFWAMLEKEKSMGITTHFMTPEIDQGSIIYQYKYPFNYQDTLVTNYEKAYAASVQATIKTIKILSLPYKPTIRKPKKVNYFTFPKFGDWQNFFKQGRNYI